jgi:hypothetical protein
MGGLVRILLADAVEREFGQARSDFGGEHLRGGGQAGEDQNREQFHRFFYIRRTGKL